MVEFALFRQQTVTSVKEGLEATKNALSVFSTSDKVQETNLDTFLFVDLSEFNIIASSLIGIFGSLIMDEKISLLALCGIQTSVKDIVKRFGVISDEGMGRISRSKKSMLILARWSPSIPSTMDSYTSPPS